MTDPTSYERPPLGPADKALIAAEQEIADLRRKSDALVAAGDDRDHPEIWNRVFALDTYIAKTAPDSIAGAVVKLRRLADDAVGLEAGEGDYDVESVRQILGAVEPAIGTAARVASVASPDLLVILGDRLAAETENYETFNRRFIAERKGPNQLKYERLMEEAHVRLGALEMAICALRAETPEGALVQARALTSFIMDDSDYPAEVRERDLHYRLMALESITGFLEMMTGLGQERFAGRFYGACYTARWPDMAARKQR